ncbi:MAG: lytic transglycosylase domain-containing protein [Rhodopseudomonas sp.]|uniref:lytic transglycosylase domain-containing protein n=1 Tax=Rhodopseudomonas sp. TaxID=1078 RepID=UPI001811EAB9|nr:lytic transglycosylase domain-containing protein [Rhodopseudomonas sp.]NVN87520.1 lytic transglycosylase domain-containing protein [Rhodopseudomonas sp.]
MKFLSAALLCAVVVLVASRPALAQHPEYNALVATHAKANGVPESLVHRLIKRESGYRAALVGRGGTIGLMQIKLGTARSLGYTGTAEGLRDPATNLTYAVKYLAGAFLAAKGDHNRTISYYSAGYYLAAKRQRAERHDKVAGVKPVGDGAASATQAPAAVAPAAAAPPAKPVPVDAKP